MTWEPSRRDEAFQWSSYGRLIESIDQGAFTDGRMDACHDEAEKAPKPRIYNRLRTRSGGGMRTPFMYLLTFWLVLPDWARCSCAGSERVGVRVDHVTRTSVNRRGVGSIPVRGANFRKSEIRDPRVNTPKPLSALSVYPYATKGFATTAVKDSKLSFVARKSD